MTRQIEIKIPRLPVLPAVASVPSDSGGGGGSGPLKWEWSSQYGITPPPPTSLLAGINGYVFASCPGATSYRLTYIETGPLPFFPVTGGVIISCNQYITAYIHATIPGVGEIGPIELVITG